MTRRIERARYLGEQLDEAMTRLAGSTRGTDAAQFLDRLARLEGYHPDEVEAVEGLAVLIAEAQAARDEHAADLGAATGQSLDVDHFLTVGRHLGVGGTLGERDGWLRDLLLIATVLPWLTPARQLLARGALAKASALVEAEAEAFLAASVLATDRRVHEQPSALSPEAQAVLALLDELPLLVVFDRTGAEASLGTLSRALEAVETALIDDADDALDDHALRRRPTLPSRSERMAMAAADEKHFPLCRTESGVWVLVRLAGQARLRWHPEGAATDASVELLDDVASGLIPHDDGGDFILPPADEPLTLRLRVGPDSRVVVPLALGGLKWSLEPSDEPSTSSVGHLARRSSCVLS